MMAADMSDLDWRVRLHVYRHSVDHERPPTYAETAHTLGLDAEVARQAYRRLHDAHALFLQPGTDTIRMANPLSAVPTAYRVHVEGRRLYANCAWDSLGIPAMLHADARIEATTGMGEPADYAIESGQLKATDGGSVMHVALPFRRWYDDLIHT